MSRLAECDARSTGPSHFEIIASTRLNDLLQTRCSVSNSSTHWDCYLVVSQSLSGKERGEDVTHLAPSTPVCSYVPKLT